MLIFVGWSILDKATFGKYVVYLLSSKLIFCKDNFTVVDCFLFQDSQLYSLIFMGSIFKV